MNNVHRFSNGTNGFQVSSLLQDLIVYAGQLDVYEKSNEVLEKFVGVEVSTMQVHKITNFYGGHCNVNEELLEPVLSPKNKPGEVLYVEVDGSMLYTRDDGWKEVKVGRIFLSSDCIHPQGKAGYIRHSQYYAGLMDSKKFTQKMDILLDAYSLRQEQLVFITDGGVWIKNWIADAFPKSTAVLDYYHAVEYLARFASAGICDEKRQQWVQEQKELLLKSKVSQVIQNIETIKVDGPEKQNVLQYYQSNVERMNYQEYTIIGAGIIGSGAIESAHRTVVQKRMKLSGQKWSIQGAQNMLNLRTTKMNGNWGHIIQMTKHNIKHAA